MRYSVIVFYLNMHDYYFDVVSVEKMHLVGQVSKMLFVSTITTN